MTEKFDAGAQNVSPRDAQKGGQGALSAHHPETALKQDAPQADEPPIRNHETTQGLTSDQIALLCEIEERDSSKVTEDQKRDLARLCAEGYVSSGDDRPNSRFKLTRKGLDFLGKRGAGINEA
jgi:hypothetical protein